MKKTWIGLAGVFLLIFLAVFAADLVIYGPAWPQYDSAGRLVGERHPQSKGRYLRYEYAEDGLLAKKKEYNGLFTLRTVFYYENGNLRREEELDSNGEVWRTYTYNDAGNLIREEHLSSNGEVWRTYTYDDAGNLICQEPADNGAASGTYQTYSYFDDGTIQEELFYQENILIERLQYDKQGRVISRIKYIDSRAAVEVRYVYESDGSYREDTYDGKEIKSSVFYTADGQKSHDAWYEYRNGLVYKAWYTYPNGVQEYVIFTYDEQGKLKTESYYTPGGELIREISREDKKPQELG